MNIIETNLNFNSLVYNNVPKEIILHHAEANGCTIKDINTWHKNQGWAGVGYHYYVRKDGTIYRGRTENAQGAHCPGHNTTSIGICAEGRYQEDTMPEIQKNAIVELCKDIKNRYSIDKIYRHKDLYSTDCPGANYPFDEIVSRVNNIEEEYVVNKAIDVFCEKWYVDTYKDVREAIEKGIFKDGYEHWVKYGQHEKNRKPNIGLPENWNEAAYLYNNQDVNKNVSTGKGFVSGAEHYLKVGYRETARKNSWVSIKVAENEEAKEESKNIETFFRVVAGSYKDKSNAEEQIDKLKDLGVEGVFLATFEK